MDLITTIAHHTANSYGTLEEAEAYLLKYDRIDSGSTWNNLSDDQKKYALMIAAKVLNTFSFRGVKVNKQQKLAFPRYTDEQIDDGYAQLSSFYEIEYQTVVDGEDLTVSDNQFVSTDSLQNTFYDYLTDGTLQINQMIKVVRSTSEYLTLIDMDADGAWIEVQESVEQETDLTTSIYASNIYGIPFEVFQAQVELAFQVVDTKIFQGTIGDSTEYPVASFNISDALTVRYKHDLTAANKFENTVPLDIVFYLLGNWIAALKGRMV
jgi:predicted small secreted protein